MSCTGSLFLHLLLRLQWSISGEETEKSRNPWWLNISFEMAKSLLTQMATSKSRTFFKEKSLHSVKIKFMLCCSLKGDNLWASLMVPREAQSSCAFLHPVNGHLDWRRWIHGKDTCQTIKTEDTEISLGISYWEKKSWTNQNENPYFQGQIHNFL